MMIKRKIPIWLLGAITVWSIGLLAQHSGHSPGQAQKIEGEVTGLLNASTHCTPTFTLKTSEGKQYTVHLPALRDSEGKLFNPRVGERITVTGGPCCGMMGPTMIHSTEVSVAGKTYKPILGPSETDSPGMMCHGMMSGCGAGGCGMNCQHQ